MLDATVVLDNNAALRHQDRVALFEADDPLEQMAAQYGISYVRLGDRSLDRESGVPIFREEGFVGAIQKVVDLLES